MLISSMVFIFGITVSHPRRCITVRYTLPLLFAAAGDLIAREAGAYSCDPSGKRRKSVVLSR